MQATVTARKWTTNTQWKWDDEQWKKRAHEREGEREGKKERKRARERVRSKKWRTRAEETNKNAHVEFCVQICFNIMSTWSLKATPRDIRSSFTFERQSKSSAVFRASAFGCVKRARQSMIAFNSARADRELRLAGRISTADRILWTRPLSQNIFQKKSSIKINLLPKRLTTICFDAGLITINGH